MMKSLKYFILFTILLLTGGVFIAGKTINNYVIDHVLVGPVYFQHQHVAKHYTKQIWCRFAPLFDEMSDIPTEQWKQHERYSAFSKLSNTILGTVPASLVSLYNHKQENFFITHQKTPIHDRQYNISSGAVFIPDMTMNHADGTTTKGSFIRSHINISSEDCPDQKVNHKPVTMELYSYVSQEALTRLTDMHYWLTMLMGAVCIVFYGVFLLVLKSNERIISEQQDEKIALEKAKARAETQNEEKSMFLANVSHELRTPLNAIIGFSEIIKDEVMGPVGHPQYAEYINDINGSGVHLLSLINDILDYSKAEARKLEIDKVDMELTKIAHSCMRLVEPRANDGQVKLVEQMPDHPVMMQADPKRMKQIILNVLSNAVKFTPENGEVRLSVKEDLMNHTVELSVTDTGIGIAQNDIAKAMAPFGQIDNSLSRRYEGTGLGLPLTKKLTDIMGGEFILKSEVGIGTTITLIFPVEHKDH